MTASAEAKARIDAIAASLLEDIGVPKQEAKKQIKEARTAPLREAYVPPEVGRPVAVVLFWQEMHCITCGATYSGPRYGQGAFLKRWFSRARFFSHEPIHNITGSMYEKLPRRVDTTVMSLHNCPACMDTKAVDVAQTSFEFPAPETNQ